MCTRMGFPANPLAQVQEQLGSRSPLTYTLAFLWASPIRAQDGLRTYRPQGTIQKAKPLTLPCVGQLSTSHWTGREWEGRDEQSKTGAQAWSRNSVFTLVYLLIGCVHLEKL